MNKVTDPQPRIYAFIYELGKMTASEIKSYLTEVDQLITDINGMPTEDFVKAYPEFKLGQEAQAAKAKVEDLKPKKKTKKEKK
jgi:hypothetical protein